MTHPLLIDETVEPELKNRTKTRHASFTMFMMHNLPAEFFWSDTWEYRLMKDGTSLHELTLHTFRRLLWLGTVSRIQTATQYDELRTILHTTERAKHLMRVIPEKALAMPGELSPGEYYEVVAQIISVLTLERVSRRGGFKFTEEEGRWSDLATVCRQAKGPWLLDFI